ncbi:MAG TPA: hypothetical protein VNZ27_14640 [Rhodanobacter sp.]|jgi:hypothetical protein|nr:hypothetical protein [Rhodanobacter sp.]
MNMEHEGNAEREVMSRRFGIWKVIQVCAEGLRTSGSIFTKTNRGLVMKRTSLLLVACVVGGIAVSAQAAQTGAANGQASGPVTLKLSSFYAYAPNGSRLPSKDKECAQLYADFLNSSMSTLFDTNPSTSWAKSTWSVKGNPDVVFDLHPLGMAGVYAYGNWYRKTFNGKEVYGVTFTANMDKGSSRPAPPYKSVISFIANANLTCALMNDTPLKTLPAEAHSDAKHAM